MDACAVNPLPQTLVYGQSSIRLIAVHQVYWQAGARTNWYAYGTLDVVAVLHLTELGPNRGALSYHPSLSSGTVGTARG